MYKVKGNSLVYNNYKVKPRSEVYKGGDIFFFWGDFSRSWALINKKATTSLY